jgi:hypothetical protein
MPTPPLTSLRWLHAEVSARTTDTSGRARLARAFGDRGEGVISAAIAVLIMAFLGAAMWVGFNRMWQATEATTNEKVEQIGQG